MESEPRKKTNIKIDENKMQIQNYRHTYESFKEITIFLLIFCQAKLN